MGDISDYVNSRLELSKPKRTINTPFPASQYKRTTICPKCGGIMHKKSGTYGTFWGCDAYPKCKGARGVLM